MGMPRQMMTGNRSNSWEIKKIIQKQMGFCLCLKIDARQYFLQTVKRGVVTSCPLFLSAESDPTAFVSGR